MKTGKYIDHNILLACLSTPKATEPGPETQETNDIVKEFYEALNLATKRPGKAAREFGEQSLQYGLK